VFELASVTGVRVRQGGVRRDELAGLGLCWHPAWGHSLPVTGLFRAGWLY